MPRHASYSLLIKLASWQLATMQDLLELDEAARMNFPSTLGGNWFRRMTEDQLTPAVEEGLT